MTIRLVSVVALFGALAFIGMTSNALALEVCDQQKQECINILQPECVNSCSTYLEEWGTLYHGSQWQVWCLYNPTYCQAVFDQCYVACMAQVEATCEGVRIDCEALHAR
jgi:hypothetical protein